MKLKSRKNIALFCLVIVVGLLGIAYLIFSCPQEKVEVQYEWIKGHLVMTVRVSSRVFEKSSYVGLVFDSNGNEEIEIDDYAYAFRADNTTYYGGKALVNLEGTLTFAQMSPTPSDFHECIFDSKGYVFKVLLPQNENISVEAGTFVRLIVEFPEEDEKWTVFIEEFHI